MRILKRDGVEAEFDRKKIERAIEKANKSVTANERLSEDVIKDIALKIEQDCSCRRYYSYRRKRTGQSNLRYHERRCICPCE